MRILLSIFLLLVFPMGCSNCRPSSAPEDLAGSYIEIYDRAISYYYRHPRQPEKAVDLLRRACTGIKDHQALSCYNLGHLLELEGDRTGALEAYRQAVKLKSDPIFEGALFRLDPEPGKLTSPYLQGLANTVEECRQGKPAQALKSMSEVIERIGRFQKSERPDREAFEQPFFEECLGKEPGYRALLKKMDSARSPDPAYLYYRDRAKKHPFHSLWDMELKLRGLDHSRSSRHPLTGNWQKILKFTRRQKYMEAGLALNEFYKQLNNMLNATEQITCKKRQRRKQKLRAIGRAAALLISQDHYFRKLRSEEKVAGLIAPWLK